ncbi:hypothetical protein BDZ89DRAFT_157500 [Hymenopellis radicata]|nr:hypothetical protein BDZ89DRAFT_157500 [Hymenopellis radicata]
MRNRIGTRTYDSTRLIIIPVSISRPIIRTHIMITASHILNVGCVDGFQNHYDSDFRGAVAIAERSKGGSSSISGGICTNSIISSNTLIVFAFFWFIV